MLTAKSSISKKRKTPRARLVFGIGAMSIVAATGAIAASNPVQPENPAPVSAPKASVKADAGVNQRPAAASPAGHLETLDALRSELEVQKLRREIAKVKAEIRDAENPAALTGLPPLPGGAMSLMPPASLDVPPLPASRSANSNPDGRLLEAWGSGMDRQARISTNGGDRIVRVGDQVAGGRVISISGSAVVIDVRGKRKVIE